MYGDRLELYCNQIAILERATEPDEWGAAGYDPPERIEVRKEMNRKLVRDAEGNTVVSDTTVFSVMQIGLQDKIDGAEVIGVSNWVDMDGEVCGWEAYL